MEEEHSGKNMKKFVENVRVPLYSCRISESYNREQNSWSIFFSELRFPPPPPPPTAMLDADENVID